jgi:hypothetical protein
MMEDQQTIIIILMYLLIFNRVHRWNHRTDGGVKETLNLGMSLNLERKQK